MIDQLTKSLIDGDIKRTEELTRIALEADIPATDILNIGLLPGLDEVGRRYEQGEYYFPELLASGEAMKRALVLLKPELNKSGSTAVGKYAIGTVRGDVHDIGKNIVIMMLEANGWDVTDLGVDVPTEKFCEAIRENDFNILGMSALLITTINRLQETINTLKEEGLRDRVRIMVGGVSVTQDYADQIGADGYATNAIAAVTVAKRLVNRL